MSDFKHTILCVDDEENILHSIKRLLRKEGYRLLTASSGEEGFEILKRNQIHLVISDQRMPEMSGTEFLAQVKEVYPDILRIILTGYTDVDSITESINKGHIYKFFLKPWNDHNLKLEIRQALEQYDLIQANKRLDETVMQQNQQLKEINEKLENVLAARNREINYQSQVLELSHAILEDLPLPIIGVDDDAVIVLANKQACDMIDIKVGGHLSECFSPEVVNAVRQVLDSGQALHIEASGLKRQTCKADLLPLSGRYRGKGIIMTLQS